MGDFALHLSCISHRMLQVFASAGHYHYAKAARLYVQLMLAYEEGSAMQRAVIDSFKSSGSHVVRYSSHEWSGIWSDLCIEQTLMRTAKSNGGLSGGRFRNSESAHRSWVQTLSHLSLINSLSSQKKLSKSTHRDLGKSQQKADGMVVTSIGKWLEELEPFDETRDKKVLISLSTGFYSKGEDGINPENALHVGEMIQEQLNGQVPSAKIAVKQKVKSLSVLRKHPTSNQAGSEVNAMKFFNRLVIFAQREVNLEAAFEYELGPIPVSLFSTKDQLMYEADKAAFGQVLKQKVSTTVLHRANVGLMVIDGGWLLRQCSWEKGDTWATIGSKYIQRIESIGAHSERIEVVFDGYESSTKDHTHRRRQKHFCHDMMINADKLPYASKDKFLSNGKNKTEFVNFLANLPRAEYIGVTCCRDDADTSIVKCIVDHAADRIVEVRAEDNDILIMLIHHLSSNHRPVLLTTSKGRYNISEIAESLTELQKLYLLLIHAFTGCDTVSSIFGFSKAKLFDLLTSTDILRAQFDLFYNSNSRIEDIHKAGIDIFQYIYNSLGTPLSKVRFYRYNKQSKVGVIRPQGLPPTDSAAAQHSLRAYLQLQDWLVLRSMSRDPLSYGWYQNAYGYEPVMMTKPMAPDHLLKFLSCNCKGLCSTNHCSCKQNKVKCISACGNCHGTDCANVETEANMDV